MLSVDVAICGAVEVEEGKKVGQTIPQQSLRLSPEVWIAGRVLKEAEISEEEEPHELVALCVCVCVRVKKCESFSYGAEEKSFCSHRRVAYRNGKGSSCSGE